MHYKISLLHESVPEVRKLFVIENQISKSEERRLYKLQLRNYFESVPVF